MRLLRFAIVVVMLSVSSVAKADQPTLNLALASRNSGPTILVSILLVIPSWTTWYRKIIKMNLSA